MRLALILFVIGILFIFIGYINQLDPGCVQGTDIRILPRNTYDQIIKDSTL